MNLSGTPQSWRSPAAVTLMLGNRFALSLAEQRGYTVTVSALDEHVLEVTGPTDLIELPLADVLGLRVPSWAEPAVSAVQALARAGYRLPGLSLSYRCDLAVAAPGVLRLAVVAAVSELCDLGLTRANWVELAGADAALLTTALASDGQALLCDLSTGTVEHLPLDLHRHGCQLLVTDCGEITEPAAGGLDCAAGGGLDCAAGGLDSYRRGEDERAAAGAELLRAELVGPELFGAELLGARQLRAELLQARQLRAGQPWAGQLPAGQLSQLGQLLTAAGTSAQHSLPGPHPEVELAVAVMLAFDAFGARMVDRNRAIGLLTPRQARAGEVAIRSAFSGRGYAEPVSRIVYPGEGLHRID